MLTIIILLAAGLILALRAFARQLIINRLLAIQSLHVMETNRALREFCHEPEKAVSDATDNDARIHFAIKCGFIAAIASNNVKEDQGKRTDALRAGYEYFKKEVPGVVAASNH